MTAPNNTADAPVDPDNLLGDAPDGDADGDADGPSVPELGDAGKKALDDMKSKWKTERDRAKLLEQRLADASKPKAASGDTDLDAIRAEAAKAATAKANERILRSEIRAQATGKLANPALALRLLDLTEFEVDDDGNVDTGDVSDAIAKLIEENPGLGVTQGEPKRFKGSGDSGPKGNPAGKPQLTQSDVKRLYAARDYAAIEKARTDGRLNTVLGIT